MQSDSYSRQLVLFSNELMSWQMFPTEVQQSISEILSLLIEQSLDQQTLDQNGTGSEKHHND